MTPGLRTLDRTLCGLLGLLLTAAGAAGIAWHYQHLAPTVAELSTTPALHTTTSWWWPWTLGATALILITAGSWWLISHLPRPTRTQTILKGSSPAGVLRLDVDSTAKAAAATLAAHDAINSAKATTRRERGHDVIAITATAPRDHFDAAAHAATEVHNQLATVLDGTHTQTRTLLHLTNSHTTRRRVR